jgi:CDP-diacylglycerol--serine O-phosphatidyltransferase
VKYPTFKSLDFRAKRSFQKMLAIVLVIGFCLLLWERLFPLVAPLVFTAFLLYGFIRPWIPRKTRHNLEDEDEDEEPGPASPT